MIYFRIYIDKDGNPSIMDKGKPTFPGARDVLVTTIMAMNGTHARAVFTALFNDSSKASRLAWRRDTMLGTPVLR